MNKLIKQQLEKVQLADLSNFDPDTNTYHIPQHRAIILKEDDYYDIKLKSSILTDTALRDNWNRGSTFPSFRYKAEVEKVIGRMVKINGVVVDAEGNDTNSFWSGWISTDYIESASKI